MIQHLIALHNRIWESNLKAEDRKERKIPNLGNRVPTKVRKEAPGALNKTISSVF